MMDSFRKISNLKENYDSVSSFGNNISEADFIIKRRPYPSTRNKSMPKFFDSEETLFLAARYETNKLFSEIGHNGKYFILRFLLLKL